MSGICPCTMGNSISKALFGMRDAKKHNSDEPRQSAKATVLSRAVERTTKITNFQESPWLYLVTFRLESGEELRLNAKEEAFPQLKEDTAWTITWQGTELLSFE